MEIPAANMAPGTIIVIAGVLFKIQQKLGPPKLKLEAQRSAHIHVLASHQKNALEPDG